ncbi:MAG: hypothetical protein HFI94_04225 [Lachnospiraceae bacterium]|nr:hypothetical protein [Lachnospiraceae bacterium]
MIQIERWEGAKRLMLLGAFLSFFGILYYIAPIGIYPDSGSYISMQEGREPLYPLFLAFFRFIFQEADTIVWLASSGQLESEKAMELIRTWPALRVSMLLQSLFAACSCYYVTICIKKVFQLKGGLTILTGLCTLIPYLLTPLASSSHMVLNMAVLTEGISFPMYSMFGGSIILGIFEEEKKYRYYLWAFLWALLLALTRNQMLVTFGVWIVSVCFEILRSRKWKSILLLCLSVVLFFGGRRGITQIYNSVAHKGYEGANTGSYNILTTLLYLSEREDGEALTEEEDRLLFLEMYEQMNAEGMTRLSAPSGILNRAYHYEEYYDVIGFEIQQPCLFGYVQKNDIPEEEALNEVMHIAARMDRELFPRLMGRYISNYFATAASGLTRSVSASGRVMGIYSVFIYFIAGILMIYLYKNNRKSRAALLMLLALVMIGVNVFATALMIMCLSRYMIYNTALFYIAGLMCLKELYEKKKITIL